MGEGERQSARLLHRALPGVRLMRTQWRAVAEASKATICIYRKKERQYYAHTDNIHATHAYVSLVGRALANTACIIHAIISSVGGVQIVDSLA